MAGTDWLMFLAAELGKNDVYFLRRLQKENLKRPRPAGRFAEPGQKLNPSTLRKHYSEPLDPCPATQSLVRQTFSQIAAATGLAGWDDAWHAYDAFQADANRILAPMQLRNPQPLPDSYINPFVLIRESFEDTGRFVADCISIEPQKRGGSHLVVWHAKNARGVYSRNRGFAQVTGMHVLIHVASTDSQSINSFRLGRNGNDDTARIAGLLGGGWDIDRAPLTRSVYLVRLPFAARLGNAWMPYAKAVEEEIASNGHGEMSLGRLHAPLACIRQIPESLLGIARQTLALPVANEPALLASPLRREQRLSG